MFEDYRVVIRYTDGSVVQGFSPSIEPLRKIVRYAGTADELPNTRTAPLAGAQVVAVIRDASQPPSTSFTTGRPVKVRLQNGDTVAGMSRPVPIPGGIWLRPETSPDDNMLLFIPEASTEAVEFGMPPMPRFESDMMQTVSAMGAVDPRRVLDDDNATVDELDIDIDIEIDDHFNTDQVAVPRSLS